MPDPKLFNAQANDYSFDSVRAPLRYRRAWRPWHATQRIGRRAARDTA